MSANSDHPSWVRQSVRFIGRLSQAYKMGNCWRALFSCVLDTNFVSVIANPSPDSALWGSRGDYESALFDLLAKNPCR